jgi:hypothetical protein
VIIVKRKVIIVKRAMDAISSELNKSGSRGSERSSSEDKDRGYFGGWVYHLGVNSIGREYCHLRFLYIRGKYVCMYKRDPHDNPAIVMFSSLSLYFIHSLPTVNYFSQTIFK